MNKSLNSIQSSGNNTNYDRLHRKNSSVIGSIHCNKIYYPRNVPFFPKVNSPKIIGVKRIIKSSIDKNILGRKDQEWNQSSLPVFNSNLKSKLFKIKKGLLSHNATSIVEQNPYYGCEEKNKYYSGWNMSSLYDKRLFKEKEDKIYNNDIPNTKLKQIKLLKKYSSPFQKAKAYFSNLRYEKDRYKKIEEEIANTLLFHNPLLVLSPDNKIQFNKYSFIESQRQPSKSNLNKTDVDCSKHINRKRDKSKIQCIKYHDGVYKIIQSLGTEAWSCCLQPSIDATVK